MDYEEDVQHESLSRSPSLWLWGGLAVCALVGMAVVIFLGDWRDNAPPGGWPAIGRELPAISLAPLTGGSSEVTRKEIAGKVVVLNFWGVWCGPCVREFPEMVELAAKYRDQSDFLMLAVSIPGDPETLREDTEAFLERNHYELSTYDDPSQKTWRAVRKASGGGNLGVPTTIVLDRKGIIRGFWEGYDSKNVPEMDALVAKLLKAGETDKAETSKSSDSDSAT